MKRILLSAALVAICLAALAAPALAQSGNTWTINYFNNTDWAGSPVMTQCSPYISFNWGTGSPGPAVPVDNFTARMTTDVFFYWDHQFSAVADDEMAVIVDGVTYLDTRGKAQSGKILRIQRADDGRATITSKCSTASSRWTLTFT